MSAIKKLAAPQYDVVSLTAICVDVRIEVTDEALKGYGLEKGDSYTVKQEVLDAIMAAPGEKQLIAGSAGGNVAAGIALRGGKSAIIGKIANDDNGAFFQKRAKANDVHYEPIYSTNKDTPTTCVTALITPDKDRTFAFLPGAGAELTAEEVEGQRDLIANAKITYIDSYLWLSENGKEAVQQAVELARKAGSRVALALNSARVVEENRDAFLAMIKSSDVLLGDQNEFAKLLGTDNLGATVDALKKIGCTASITAGKAGAHVLAADKLFFIPSLGVPKEKIVDTNGAGDSFASGFIYGLAEGKGPAEAGNQGATWAAAVIQHAGAEPRVGKNALPTTTAPKTNTPTL